MKNIKTKIISIFLSVLAATFAVFLFADVNNDLLVHAAPPSEFEVTDLVTDLDQPTAFRVLPDGRILITEKKGAIKVLENGVMNPNPVITIVTLDTDNADERGLLGLEPDPDFATNGYLYVAYTTAQNFDRLSRITITGITADISSEVVLLESNQQGNIYHHGGEVRFGPDGKLYWALGMNTYNPNSQNLSNVHGKIHRINKDGTIPTDNPFYSTPGVLKSIWAYGLRNPFRFTFTPSGNVILGDVGGDAWEEVNILSKGANYGWPLAEGTCTGCAFANPIFVYPHTPPPAKAGSITSTLIYNGNTFPNEYQNAFFYGDYTLGYIKYLKFDSQFESVISDNTFDADAGTVVQLSQGTDGNIYKLTFYPGTLSKISLSNGNRSPVAKIVPSIIAGLTPLTVFFDSSGTFDPDGDNLSYILDFGDGNTSSDPNSSHVYTINGTYNATLTVSDGQKTDQDTVIITVGNSLPNGSISFPISQSKYNAGDIISFSATGTDPEDAELPDSAFSWNFNFHHGNHIHPFWHSVNNQRSGQFTIPQSADNLANTWYEIELTATDSQGLSTKTSTKIYPNLINLTFNSNKANASYAIDGIPFSGVHTESAVVGVERVLNASSPQYYQEKYFQFANWSDGGEQSHTIVTPSTDYSYIANFDEFNVPPTPWQSIDIGSPAKVGSASYSNGSFTLHGAGGDIWGPTDEFRYVYQSLSGNGEIVARVTSQLNTDDWAKSGIMIKESASAGSKYVLLGVTPSNGLSFQYNFNTEGGNVAYAFPNAWLKLVRFNQTFTAFSSTDGINWQQIGSADVQMNEDVTFGMFVTSHKYNQLNTSVFDNISTKENLTGLWQNTDIGNPKTVGNSEYNSGQFIVNGAGDDIWDNSDQFQYVYQSLDGNGQITARLSAQSEMSDGWAKAGVMVKQNLNTGSQYALFGVTPLHGYTFQNNFINGSTWGEFSFPNAWVRLIREGNLISSFLSSDGQNWTPAGSATINFSGPVTFGLFVTSHNGSQISQAVFDNVELVSLGQLGTLPSPFMATDIGGPRLLGSASFNSGTYSLKASGDDIWGDSDQMHFVNQDLVGNGEIIARVTSQTNTNDWAKAGIIIKDSIQSHSNYALVSVTPSNGIVMQYNFNGEISGPSYLFPNVWLKLKRDGNNISSFSSVDGFSWNLIGTKTVILNPLAKIGLFVTSHDGSKLSTATFDNVTVVSNPTSSLPAPWVSGDVGNPSLSGSSSSSNDIFTLSGSGNDIWDQTDQFHFVYQSLNGDGQITARVISQTNTNDWAKAGIIIKDSLVSGSDYALLAVTPQNGLAFQNSFNTNTNGQTYTFPEIYLRLVRSGNIVSAYKSTNGVDWDLYGSQTVSLAHGVLIGLFVVSHNGSLLSTAAFDSVLVLD